MKLSESCLIDNWSLEQAALIFESDSLESFPDNDRFINALGGLSNYINAVLLYDNIKYVDNGYQYAWQRFPTFKQKTLKHIKPFITDTYYHYFDSPSSKNQNLGFELASDRLGDYLSIEDYVSSYNGATNYLLTSQYLDSDLFISPERAKLITQECSRSNQFYKILAKIDTKIKKEKDGVDWIDNEPMGRIESNFILPALTHYVLSKASSIDDLLKVIMHLKATNEMGFYRKCIKELSQSTKDFTKFHYEVENIINESLGKPGKKDKPWAIKMNVLFLTLTKSFNLDRVFEKQLITFLRSLINNRKEMESLEMDIERIFKRKIQI